MRRTWRAKGGLLVVLLLYLFAYAFKTVTPALLGTILLAYLATAHARFRLLLDHVAAQADTDPPDRPPHQGEPVEISRRIRITPPGLYVNASLPPGPGYIAHDVNLHRDASTPEADLYTVTARLSATQRGRIDQPMLTLHLTDPEDLFEHQVHLNAPARFTAHAPRSTFEEHRHVRRLQRLLQGHSPQPDEPAPRRSHPAYQTQEDPLPGAVHQQPPPSTHNVLRPLTVVLDVSDTMRHRTDHGPMLDHAIRITEALVASTHRRGHPAGLIAYDDHKILEHVRPSREEPLPSRVARALAMLPDAIDTTPQDTRYVVREPPAEPDMNQDPEDRDQPPDATQFEKPLSLGGDSQHGLSQALARATQTKPPGTIVLVTDLQTDPERTDLAIEHALRHDHHVVVASTFTPFYHLDPDELTPNLLEDVYNAWNKHRYATQRLEALGADVIDLAPGSRPYELFQRLTENEPPLPEGRMTR